MNDSIDYAQKLTDSLISGLKSTKSEIITANIKLWDLTKIPDMRSWPAAGEATFWRFSLTAAKGRLLYTPWLSLLMVRKRRKKGLQPSEIKDRDERLSGALDFIHLLGKRS